MRRGYNGFVPVGNISVPFTFRGEMSQKEKKVKEKNEKMIEEEIKKERYLQERKEIVPLVVQSIDQLLVQNGNLEEHLSQLLEVLKMLCTNSSCNDFITISLSKFLNNGYYINFTALDRTLDNNEKNMPLFNITLETNEIGEIIWLQMSCARLIGEGKYSFDKQDCLALEIQKANEPVATVIKYDTNSIHLYNKKILESYDVSSSKKIVNNL